jgi:predicted ATPase
MIAGEPGIGKTRLMLEAASLAESMRMIPVWGRCREDGGAPAFLPWVQILRSGIDQHGEDLDHWERHWPELVSLLQPVTGA